MRALITLVFVTLVYAQAPAPRPFTVVRLDPALDAIIATDAKLEILGEHFGLTEGPVWIQENGGGYLLFSDCARHRYLEHRPANRQRATGDSADRIQRPALDPQGRLVITAMADRTVTRLEKDGKRTVLADRYEGKRLSGPNDVVVKSDGAVYFTDSVNGLRGGATGPLRELPFNGVYRVKDGSLTLLDSDRDRPGEFPNGIAFSQDEKHLYVTAEFGKTLRWDVQPDGSIANPKTFIPAGNDGMKVDRKGNVYSTNAVGLGEIWITSPEGKHLGTLQLPQIQGEPRPRICATNVAFGDADGKGLYITSCTHLFKVRLKASAK